jgi:hypothetical protein
MGRCWADSSGRGGGALWPVVTHGPTEAATRLDLGQRGMGRPRWWRVGRGKLGWQHGLRWRRRVVGGGIRADRGGVV